MNKMLRISETNSVNLTYLTFRNTLLVFIGAERDKNEKLESQLELSNTFKDKNTNDLQETQTESSKLSKILLPHKNRKQAVGGSE